MQQTTHLLNVLLTLAEDDVQSAYILARSNHLIPQLLRNLTPKQLTQLNPNLK